MWGSGTSGAGWGAGGAGVVGRMYRGQVGANSIRSFARNPAPTVRAPLPPRPPLQAPRIPPAPVTAHRPLVTGALAGWSSLKSLAAAVLAQIWGQLSSRGSAGPKIGGQTEEFTGGTTRYRVTTATYVRTTAISLCSNSQPQADTNTGGPVTGSWQGPFVKVRVEAGPGTTTVNYVCSGTSSTTTTRSRVLGVRADNTTLELATFDLQAGTINNSGAWRGTRVYTGAVTNLEGENGWRWNRAERPAGVGIPALDPLPAVVPTPQPTLPPQPAPAPPAGDPLPDPEPKPGQPATTPAAPPAVKPMPVTRPAAPRPVTITDAGTMPAPTPDPPTVTNPDWHYPIPGAGPVTGNGPQAKPEEIAKELGRLEQKLNAVLNPTPDTPIEWQRVIGQVIEALVSLTAGTTYTLTEQCEQCDPANPVQPASVSVGAPGAINAFGVIANKVDAVAELLNAQLGLKQKVCEPCPAKPLVGKNISIQFRSTVISPLGENKLRKVFRYRDPTYKELELHRDHWINFEWESGPWMVISEGLGWGKPQVWAKSEAEGKRVLAHAAAICGVNLGHPDHRWRVHQAVGIRERPVLKMKVHRDANGRYWVAERSAPAGFPLVTPEVVTDPGVGG